MKLIYSIITLCLLCSGISHAQQIEARIKGLETNPDYMELLRQESLISSRQDSLADRVADVRALFREHPDRRAELGGQILQLESEIFEARNEAGLVSSRINQIEQQYIIANLSDQGEGVGQSVGVDTTLSDSVLVDRRLSANLVYNDYFKENLLPADYAALIVAQQGETETDRLFTSYRTYYQEVKSLEQAYLEAQAQARADSLYGDILRLQDSIDSLSSSMAATWSSVIENKSFAYNYLFDKANNMAALELFDSKTKRAKENQTELEANNIDPNIAAYVVQKQLIFDYEKELAEVLAIGPALDSLEDARVKFRNTNKELYMIDIPERLFLDYGNVEIRQRAAYNAANPIPALKVYDKGVIYRILVGSFTRIQPVSVFRGIYPLGYVKDGARYNYYAAGYKSLEDALGGLDAVKKAGFRNARLAVWNYGDYMELNDQPNSNETQYQIVISDAGDKLPDDVLDSIRENAPDKGISKSGTTFFVGPFLTPLDAEKVADKARQINDRLRIKISAIN